jgi:4-hydroxy-2-oxovalerate aldolase
VGFNASNCGHGEAAESDEGYIKAAAEVLSTSQFGMFCIPGIGRPSDIDMAASYGMGFVRIGTDVAKVDQSREFIERAKKHGMFVAANFMKSYACEPEFFAKQAKLSQDFGADVIYIVDSSGGMLPSDLEHYFNAFQGGDLQGIPLAFHGHNNLGLAAANTLKAIELGATIVDSSLQGMGRSAGNACTEILVSTLQRMGMAEDIDLIAILDAGEKFIRPLMRKTGVSSIDVVSGYAQFHSSYMGTIRKFASKYKVDPRELIIGLCQVNKVDAPADLVESIAANLMNKQAEVFTARYSLDEYHGQEQSSALKESPNVYPVAPGAVQPVVR